jgi:hypothetical protein
MGLDMIFQWYKPYAKNREDDEGNYKTHEVPNFRVRYQAGRRRGHASKNLNRHHDHLLKVV